MKPETKKTLMHIGDLLWRIIRLLAPFGAVTFACVDTYQAQAFAEAGNTAEVVYHMAWAMILFAVWHGGPYYVEG